jgi:predicted phosphate transport protein (TIGR00153 family)
MEKWFAIRRKSKVLELADRQMTLAIDTVMDLQKTIQAGLKGDKKSAKEHSAHLSLIEHEIDELRRTIFEELTRGSMASKDREDIMHLVKRLDEMADHVKDGSRNANLLLESNIPKVFWEKLASISNHLVNCATTLRKAIEALGTNPTTAIKLAMEIDKVEGKVDEEYLETKGMFLVHVREIDSASFLFLRDMLEELEHVADACDDTGDYVRILAVAREYE